MHGQGKVSRIPCFNRHRRCRLFRGSPSTGFYPILPCRNDLWIFCCKPKCAGRFLMGGLVYGLVEPLPTVESLHGLDAHMSHQHRYLFDIDVTVQTSLSKHSATHAEVDFTLKSSSISLDPANRVAGKISVAPFFDRKTCGSSGYYPPTIF